MSVNRMVAIGNTLLKLGGKVKYKRMKGESSDAFLKRLQSNLKRSQIERAPKPKLKKADPRPNQANYTVAKYGSKAEAYKAYSRALRAWKDRQKK